MIDGYIRLESAVLRQNTAAVARALLVAELVGVAVLLAAGNEDWIYLLIGPVGIVAGLRLYRRSHLWGKVLIAAGGFPILLLLRAVHPLLMVLGMVVHALAALISLTAG